jgi:uncharacterized repeat protein (TIGR03803 family)
MNPHKLWIVCLTVAMFTAGSGEAWPQDQENVLHYFDGGNDASRPASGLIRDAAGNLYGTSWMGGSANSGVVYMLTPVTGGWREKIIHSFDGVLDGAAPFDNVVMDATGSLYGATSQAGANNQGTVFKLTPSSDGLWIYSVLYAFTGREDGGQPEALILDAGGNLYGSTGGGGIKHGQLCYYGCGVVFELSPNSDGSWNETVLHRFRGGSDGRGPSGALVLDKGGNLYGSASQGGNLGDCGGSSIGCGVVFKLSPTLTGEWKESVLYAFAGGTDGAAPAGALIFDSAGNLYGAAASGGDVQACPANGGCGVIFELVLNSIGLWEQKVLHTLTGAKGGQNPVGPLTFDAAGNLFGVAFVSGPLGGGLVFELTPDSSGNWAMKGIHTFLTGGFNGWYPNPGLLVDTNDNLYGTTGAGGPAGNDGGLAYEMKPTP